MHHLLTATAFWVLAGTWIPAHAQLRKSTDSYIRQGNRSYHQDNLDDAANAYARALDREPNSAKGLFNQGNVLYRQEDYETARQQYEITAELFDDPLQKSAALHNLGNVHFQSGALEQSIEAYKSALRLQPDDEDTRYNLALAQELLRQQQDQQQEDQQQEDQQDQDEQEQQQDQEQDQKGQDQEGQDQEQQQDAASESSEEEQSGQEETQQQGTEPEPSRLSKEDARRLLEALANDEQKVQEKVIRKKVPATNSKIEKDW